MYTPTSWGSWLNALADSLGPGWGLRVCTPHELSHEAPCGWFMDHTWNSETVDVQRWKWAASKDWGSNLGERDGNWAATWKINRTRTSQKETDDLLGMGNAVVECRTHSKMPRQENKWNNEEMVNWLAKSLPRSSLWNVEQQCLSSQTVALNPLWAPEPPGQLTK